MSLYILFTSHISKSLININILPITGVIKLNMATYININQLKELVISRYNNPIQKELHKEQLKGLGILQPL